MNAERGNGSHQHSEADEYWLRLLTGEDAIAGGARRLFRKMPSPPRCKLCYAPFAGPYAPILKMLGFRRWSLNQQLCRRCMRDLDQHQGGAEVPVSLLYTDVQGSTTLAEQLTPAEFTSALNRFFAVAFAAVDAEFGVIDHIVGDGVMALWVPGFVGGDHPQRAVTAGRRLAADLTSTRGAGDAFPAGVGVHTGLAYVGVVGQIGSLDFTVLGDAPNTVARLGSAVSSGELAMSDDIVAAAEVDTSGLDRRVLELKGKAEPFNAWIERVRVIPGSAS